MPEYRKQKRARSARQKSEALNLADNPLADEIASEVILEAEETKEIKKSEKYYDYFGGAISFAELDSYLETQEDIEHFESVTCQFRSIVENILWDDRVPTSDKAGMISAATEVYKMKLTAREKGLGERIKEYFTDLLKGKKQYPTEEHNSLEVITNKEDGSKRWFGRWSNNYKDREGEIISAEAHKEFVAYLKQYPDRMPSFWIWHTKGTARAADADFVEFFDGFMVASGPLTEKEAEQLEKAIAYDNGKTGMSHGMFVLERDPERKEIVTKYRTFEISDLPLENAANGFTSITSTKEVKMTDEKFNRLAATIGDEAAKKVMDQIGESKEILEALGVESKESQVAEILDKLEADPVEVTETEPETEVVAEPEAPAEEDKETDSSAVEKIAVELSKQLGLKELSDMLASQDATIKELSGQVAKLTKEDDQKIAEQFEDKSLGALIWKKRASESDETVVTDDKELEELKKETPISWVSEAIGGQR